MDKPVFNEIKEDEPISVSPSEVATGGVIITPSGNVLKGASTVTPGKIYQSGFHQLSVAPGESIQDAINALDTIGGGILFLEQGTHIVISAIVVKSAIQFIGENQTTTTIDFNSTAANFTLTGTDVYTTGTITSITSGVNVTGSGTLWLANVTTAHQIFIGNSWYKIAVVLTDTTLTLAEGYQGNATLPGAAYRAAKIISDVEFNELTIKNSTGTAIEMTDVRGINFEDVGFIDNNKGFTGTNIYQFVLDHIDVVSSTSNGYELTNARFCNIKSVSAPSNGGHGAVLNNFTTGSILESAANSNTSDGFNITSCTDLIVQVEASANGGQGTECVSGNDNILIQDGLFNANISGGVKLTATTDNCRIRACKITNNGGYGVNIAASTCDNNIIMGNILYIDNYTKMLLHCDGADASTTFTDDGCATKTITANGNAQVDTAQSKFGGASGLFDGTTDYLSGDLGADAIGTGDFTIDYWVRHSSFYNYISHFATTRSATGFNAGSQAGANIVFYVDPALVLDSVSAVFTVNTWHHVAFVRNSGTLKAYVDGVEKASASNSTNFSQTAFNIGARDGGAESLTGWIDEFRFSKGIARWTAAFTPESSAYNSLCNSFSNSGTDTLIRSNIGVADN